MPLPIPAATGFFGTIFTFANFLVGFIVIRILLALGFSAIIFIGGEQIADVAINAVNSLLNSGLGNLGDFLSLCGLDEAIRIIGVGLSGYVGIMLTFRAVATLGILSANI